jgi:hypothetical protein
VDKTGLFFQALPTKSLMVKGVYQGKKMYEERLTVLLCGNMVGEMKKMMWQDNLEEAREPW